MAYGDIHNHNGSICQAQYRPCPLGEGEDVHSGSLKDYVFYHADENGLDPAVIHSAIKDGMKPADAVELAKEGKLNAAPAGSSSRRGGLEGGSFRFRRSMGEADLKAMATDMQQKIYDTLSEQPEGMEGIVQLRLSDSFGGGAGVPAVAYDPSKKRYSLGVSRYGVYRAQYSSASLRPIVAKAAESYGYEDSEYNPLDLED